MGRGVRVEENSSATVSLQTCMSLPGPCGKAWAVWHESWHNALQLLTEQGDISSLERNLLTLSCGTRTPGHFSPIFLLSVEFRAFHLAPPQRVQPRLYSFLAVVWSWLLSHRVTCSRALCHPVIWSLLFLVILWDLGMQEADPCWIHQGLLSPCCWVYGSVAAASRSLWPPQCTWGLLDFLTEGNLLRWWECCVLVWVVVILMYTFIKTHQTVHLRLVPYPVSYITI